MWLKRIYRLLQSTVVKDCFLPFFFPKERMQEAARHSIDRFVDHSKDGRNCFWFHAASVGELESLWPLIQELSKDSVRLVITILSDSARGTLKKLVESLSSSSDSKAEVILLTITNRT